MVANDPVTGRSVQRSFTVRGDAEQVEEHRRKLVECLGVDRSALYCEGARWTLAEPLERFVAANDHWRPATRSSAHLDGPVPDRRPGRQVGPGRALA